MVCQLFLYTTNYSSANSTTNLASVAAMASWSLFSRFVFCSILMTWNFTVDGSTKMPNGHMDAIEPYDYRAFQPFSTAYLPGYMADKYDEDADTCQARAHSRMQNSVSSELSASITGYSSVSTLSENIHIDYTAKHYALLPVWMLHTKWQGKDYLFAMNGQTGKLVGDLPVDKRKVAAWFAGISVPLMILLAILL